MDPTSIEKFNPLPKQAALWTQEQLSPANVLRILALQTDIMVDGTQYVHGSPVGFDSYIMSNWDAMDAFNEMKSNLCFFGHTHVPGIITEEAGRRPGPLRSVYYTNRWIPLIADLKNLVNPGSIGQPRDRNPKLSLCLFDREAYAVRFVRLTYDWEGAKEAIHATQLPVFQGDRLIVGE